MIRRSLLGACCSAGRVRWAPPEPASPPRRRSRGSSESASAGELDTLWQRAPARRPPWQVGRRGQASRPRAARVPARRSAVRRRRISGRAKPSSRWEATSRPRASSGRCPTTPPTIRSHPRRCSEPATCTPTSGGGPSSTPPTARRRSPPTRSCSTATPGRRRPSGPRTRIDDLQERFAYKEYKAALYYIRLKAFDSAILYLKDLVATYPRSAVAPDALIRLVQAYRTLGYKEDVQETCGYIRRFHPKAPGVARGVSRQRGGIVSGGGAMTTASSVRSIGLLGGSFDPVHHGHLIVGQVAAEALGLDQLRFVPAREQPFKLGGTLRLGGRSRGHARSGGRGTAGICGRAARARAPGPLLHRGYPSGAPGRRARGGAHPAARCRCRRRARRLAPGRRSFRRLARIVVFARPGRRPCPAPP